MWTIEQFVEELNNKLPLYLFRTDDDKRKSKVWSVRLLREYLYFYKIKGVKEGKYVFYDHNDLLELKKSLEQKYFIDSLSKANSYSSNTIAFNNISGSNNNIENLLRTSSVSNNKVNLKNENEQSLESILEQSKSKVNMFEGIETTKHQSLKGMSGLEYSIEINPQIKLVVSDGKLSSEDAIKEVKKWLNIMGEKK